MKFIGKNQRKVHRAGQFGYFRFLSNACGYAEHPFTISSPPDSTTLSIIIKDLGDYTNKIKNISVGTKSLYDGAYGIFTPKQNSQPLLFIAGGVGITPFLSILTEWDKTEIMQPTSLIWSTQLREDLIYKDFFVGMEKKHPSFKFVPLVTRSTNSSANVQRISKELLEDIIGIQNRYTTKVYFCGPDSLNKCTRSYLASIGIRGKNFFYEKFSF